MDYVLAMSSAELEQWKDFYELEGFPTERNDIAVAILCQVVTSLVSKKVPKLSEFMLDIHTTPEQKRKQRDQQVIAGWDSFAVRKDT